MAFARTFRLALSIAALMFFTGAPVFAQSYDANGNPEQPPTLEELMNVQISGKERPKEENQEIRMEGIREAALSYGARAGLASRTFEIRQTLKLQEAYLDRIYDFKRLLIPAPSGLLIEPPVIAESEDAMIIEDQGQTAAVADRIYNINVDAKIVAAPRNWRAYLERDWGDIDPPPSVLYPTTDEEKQFWIDALKKGWDEGVEQAEEIFQADLDRLNSDFNGMIRYRMLLAQGIVSPPYTLQTDRGVTGGGKEMRVGDRALQITGPSQLQTDSNQWRPASR
ncbi:MAG: type IV secretory system conjugative DNA transfer family protein [Alphaproteobacteria bacterium]|nr:type IV secretory system conjugative DNA transfer family protein [Alphaproteobacteria bacterium]